MGALPQVWTSDLAGPACRHPLSGGGSVTSDSSHSRRRRAFTALSASVVTALTAAGLAAVVATAPSSNAETTLGSAASAKGKTFGVAVSGNRLSESQYANIADTEFTGVTAENE